MITTRRLEGDRFAAKKARDLDPEVRRGGGRAMVAEGEAWGELWRDHQNQYFEEHGLGLRVDSTATYAAPHSMLYILFSEATPIAMIETETR